MERHKHRRPPAREKKAPPELALLTRLEFQGWWSEDEKGDDPEPWERFTICLQGHEAGDIASTPEEVERVLKASGIRVLVLKELDQP